MYNILTFDNGQPFILYRENEKIYLYTIARGRIGAKGILFNNVGKDFQIFKGTPDRVYYISTSDELKVSSLYKQHFVELISIPLENKEDHTMMKDLSPVVFHDDLYIFYLCHNFSDHSTTLRYLSSSSLEQSILLKDNIDSADTLSAFSANNKIFLTLENKSTTHFYYFDSTSNLIAINNEQKMISKDVHLSEEKSKAEIAKLDDALKRLTAQYNELSEYAGKLQEDLRKAKFSLK